MVLVSNTARLPLWSIPLPLLMFPGYLKNWLFWRKNINLLPEISLSSVWKMHFCAIYVERKELL
jgi:hypothetical protein